MNSQEAEQLKKELLDNVDANFPKDRATILKRQIISMNDVQLEQFMKKQDQGCIFCSIASGMVESYKIDEDDNYLAVLEINPISKGHALIIPKKHITVENFSEDVSNFAKKVAEKIKKKLMLKNVELASANLQDHGVINLIPIYNNENINSKRYKTSQSELEEVFKRLTSKERKTEPEKTKKKALKKIIKSKKVWLPKRIP